MFKKKKLACSGTCACLGRCGGEGKSGISFYFTCFSHSVQLTINIAYTCQSSWSSQCSFSSFPKSTASPRKPEALWDLKHFNTCNMCSRTSGVFVFVFFPDKNNASFKAFILLFFFFFPLNFCLLDVFFPWVVKCSASCLLVLPNNFGLQLIFLFSFSLFTGICFLYSFTKQGIPQAVLPPLPKRPALEKTNGATAVFNTGIFQYQQALANMQLQQHTAFLPPGKGFEFVNKRP